MTVTSETAKVIVYGDDAETEFSFSPIVIFGRDDLEVTHVTSAGVETLVLEGDTEERYSIGITNFPATGSITYPAVGGTPLASGASLVIRRSLRMWQVFDGANVYGYFPETQEAVFDRLTMLDIQIQEIAERALQMPISYSGAASPNVPRPDLYPGKFLRWAAAGLALEWATPTSAGTLTTPVGVADGGTGQTTAGAAKNALAITFSANKNTTDQTGIVSDTATKVTFTTEAFDVGAHYDAANSRLNPTATGLWRLTAVVKVSANVVNGEDYTIALRKNGTAIRTYLHYASGTSAFSLRAEGLVQVNAPADYFEVYVTLSGAGNKTISGVVGDTFFTGEML